MAPFLCNDDLSGQNGSTRFVAFSKHQTTTGTTVDTIDALREARSHGAATATGTNFPWSPITEVADFVLLTAVRETAFRSGARGDQ